jgi:hypothetical protein
MIVFSLDLTQSPFGRSTEILVILPDLEFKDYCCRVLGNKTRHDNILQGKVVHVLRMILHDFVSSSRGK